MRANILTLTESTKMYYINVKTQESATSFIIFRTAKSTAKSFLVSHLWKVNFAG